jgi:hypothetical protein
MALPKALQFEKMRRQTGQKAMNKDFLYSKYARKMFWWLGLRMNVEN